MILSDTKKPTSPETEITVVGQTASWYMSYHNLSCLPHSLPPQDGHFRLVRALGNCHITGKFNVHDKLSQMHQSSVFGGPEESKSIVNWLKENASSEKHCMLNVTLLAFGRLRCTSVCSSIKTDDKRFLYCEIVRKTKWDPWKIHNPVLGRECAWEIVSNQLLAAQQIKLKWHIFLRIFMGN